MSVASDVDHADFADMDLLLSVRIRRMPCDLPIGLVRFVFFGRWFGRPVATDTLKLGTFVLFELPIEL